MNDETADAMRRILMSQWKMILNLQASDRAIQTILGELMPHVSEDARNIILKYPKLLEEERQKILLAFENNQPRLAAELDADEDSGLVPPKP